MSELIGKVALVTGASRGIGRACALRLASLGARVAVNFLSSKTEAADVVRQIQSLGTEAIAVRGDVSSPDDVEAMVEAVAGRFGGLNIVVSNAAAGGFRQLMELSPANWAATMQTNSAPLIWLTQAAAKHLSENPPGKVIAISSHGSMWAIPNYGAIGASKAALEALVRHFALELGRKGINFNSVLAGIVKTDAIRTMPGVDDILSVVEERSLVIRPTLEPEDVAGVVAFFASSAADQIQGQTIVVDGGVSLRV
jgi:enoyl-[acyl-carrier protein] reductase III